MFEHIFEFPDSREIFVWYQGIIDGIKWYLLNNIHLKPMLNESEDNLLFNNMDRIFDLDFSWLYVKNISKLQEIWISFDLISLLTMRLWDLKPCLHIVLQIIKRLWIIKSIRHHLDFDVTIQCTYIYIMKFDKQILKSTLQTKHDIVIRKSFFRDLKIFKKYYIIMILHWFMLCK